MKHTKHYRIDMKKYDIFLVCAPKDYLKIPYCLNGIHRNMRGYQNLYLCTPHVLPPKMVATIHYPVHYRIDMKVLTATPQRWRHRPAWVYQQFIKLFQRVTENDWYFVIDCDTMINKQLPVWDNADNPIWYISWEQNNPAYYNFNQKMFGYGRVYDHSFLADMGFYRRAYVDEMLNHHKYDTRDKFIQKSYSIVGPDCYPSEADIYMSYMIKRHPDVYTITQLHNKCDAMEGRDPLEDLYSKKQIEDHIKKMSKTDFDTFAIHSWIDRSHNKWQLK